MSPAGFELAIPASERPQTYALDRAATGTGSFGIYESLRGTGKKRKTAEKTKSCAMVGIYTSRQLHLQRA